MDGRCVGGLRRDRPGGWRGGGGWCGAKLSRSAGSGLGETAAALQESVRPNRVWWAGGNGRVEANVGLHGVALAAKIVDGLAGPAGTVALGLAEPVQPWFTGDGLELLALQVPVGEVRGQEGGEGGDEAVRVMGAEAKWVPGCKVAGFSSRCRGGAVSGCGARDGPR